MDGKVFQLLACGFARARLDDVNIDELSELTNALPHSIDELGLARQRSRVVTAYRLDVQLPKPGILIVIPHSIAPCRVRAHFNIALPGLRHPA